MLSNPQFTDSVAAHRITVKSMTFNAKIPKRHALKRIFAFELQVARIPCPTPIHDTIEKIGQCPSL
jgi:hypothetical protein